MARAVLRSAVLVIAVVALATPAAAGASSVSGARASVPADDDCDGAPGCDDRKPRPYVYCSWPTGEKHQWISVFGYRLEGSRPVTITPGSSENMFTPTPKDRGQPSTFSPGRNDRAVIVTHTNTLTWHLAHESAQAPGRKCQHDPLPITGNRRSLAVWVLVGAAAVLGGGFAARMRRRDR